MKQSRRKFITTSSVSLLAASGILAAQEQAVSTMLSKPIPSTGEQIPVIGLGTLEAFDVDSSANGRADLAAVLKTLIDHGGTLVDTSPRYGNAETVVGELCAEHNLTDRLFFATKVFTLGEQEGRTEMQQSFRRLQAPQIDLMQVHSMRDWKYHLPSIRNLKGEGKVRHIGVTIHRDTGHQEMMAIMREENLDFIQINYNLIERNAATEVLPLAQELGVAVMVNVPFAKAALFNKTSGMPLPDWAQNFDCSSWAQFFLKYVISHPAVTCVIPRTSSPTHMVDNLQAGFGTLPDADTRIEMESFIDSLS